MLHGYGEGGGGAVVTGIDLRSDNTKYKQFRKHCCVVLYFLRLFSFTDCHFLILQISLRKPLEAVYKSSGGSYSQCSI